MNMIIEVNKIVSCRPSKKFIISVLKRAYRSIKKTKVLNNLSVVIIDPKTIRSINKKYRKEDRVTDVLSFDDPAELIICWSQVVKQAKKEKHSQKQELCILLIHGLLHILGYHHNTKKTLVVMDKKTQKILKLLN